MALAPGVKKNLFNGIKINVQLYVIPSHVVVLRLPQPCLRSQSLIG